MPIYVFVCNGCGKHFEELCTLAEAERILCPECGGRVKRQISSFAFRSGAGFHVAASNCSGCHGSNCSSCGRH